MPSSVSINSLRDLLKNGTNCLAEATDVVVVDTGDIDSTTINDVYRVFLSQFLDLLGGESREGKHSILSTDEGKVCLSTGLLQFVDEAVADGGDAVAHAFQFRFPEAVKFFVFENRIDEMATMRGGIRVIGPDEHFKLAEDAVCFVFVFCDGMQGPNAILVEPEVFRKGVADEEFQSILRKGTDSEGIIEPTGGKSLIRKVEDGEEVSSLADFGDGFPFLLVGIDSGGIVAAGVKENAIVFRNILQNGQHAIPIQAARMRVVVGVGLNFHSGRLKNSLMVGPRWVADPYVAAVEG